MERYRLTQSIRAESSIEEFRRAQLAVPQPDLSRLEAAIRHRLTRENNDLKALVDQADTTDDEMAEAFGEMGRLYHAHYLSEPAFACYLSAQMLASQEFRWVYLLGVLYQQTSQLEHAARIFKHALEIRPDDTPAKLRLAQVYLELNEIALANPLFRETLAEDGMIAAAASGLGQSALSERRFREAVKWFEKALEEQPQATRLNYSLGFAYRSLGEVAKDKLYLQQSGDVDPEFPDPVLDDTRKLAISARIHIRHALEAANLNQLEVAVKEFRAAVAIDPDNAATRVGFARVLYQTGARDEAQSQLLEAIALDSDHAPANFFLGMLTEESGDDENAGLYLQKELETDSQHMGAHLHLANVQMRFGQYEQAAHHYHKVTEYAPYNRVAWLLEVLALTRSGAAHQRARNRLEEAIAVHPEDPILSYALARLLASSPEDSVRGGPRALIIAWELYARFPALENTETLAMVYAELGEFDRTSMLQEEAIGVAVSLGRLGTLSRLEENLRIYQRGEPCRSPWAENDPIFWAY